MLDYKKALKYNRDSLIKLKWSPSWFGAEEFNEEMIDNIVSFQESLGLTGDGLVGPATYRRILTDQLAQEAFNEKKRRARRKDMYLIYNGEKYRILWNKVRVFDEKDSLKIEGDNFYSFQDKPARQPIQFVNHWDATLSASSCARIINKRELSMHFCIDNDGTIYQLMDMQDAAFQAGNKFSNIIGLGVEISNAFYTKYQSWYVKNGFGKRPIIKDARVHGRRLEDHLGFYDIQIDALAALWECVSFACGIPLEICTTKGVDESCKDGSFSGFINHFNLTENKTDCASLDMQLVLDKALEIRASRIATSV